MDLSLSPRLGQSFRVGILSNPLSERPQTQLELKTNFKSKSRLCSFLTLAPGLSSFFETNPGCLSNRNCYIENIQSHKFNVHIHCWIRLEQSISRNKRSILLKVKFCFIATYLPFRIHNILSNILTNMQLFSLN